MAEEPDDEGPDVATTPAPAAPAAVPAVPEWLTGAQATPSAVPAPGPAPGTVDSLLVTPEQTKALHERLAEIKRNQMAASGAGAGETVARLRRDRAEMEQAYKATALPPDTLQPWDQKAKQNEYRTDPVEAFGSIGSVFAMLVPAFVGLPMEASLNAGAAAINAVHAQDDKAYDRDFKSWKENNDLALKRHEIMRQAYNDSILKMNTNLNAGRSELELNARKFGDQQVLAMLEAGMDPDVMKAVEARNKAALELKSTSDRVWLEHEKVEDLKKDPNYYIPALKARAIEDWQKRWAPQGARQLSYDAEKEYMEKWKAQNPDWSPDDYAGAVAAFRKQMTEAEGAGTPGTPGKIPTGPQQVYLAKKKYEEEVRNEHPDWPDTKIAEEANRRYKVGNPATLTSAQQGRYEDRTFLADHTLGKIDTQLKRLESRSGLTGVGGMISRGKERIGNLFGSKEVEAQEFYKDLEEMRLNAGRMLTLSQGRPLASEAARINAVLKGNGVGDLTEPTIAAMRDYGEFVRKFKEDAQSRLQNTPTPSSGVGGPNPEGVGVKPPPAAKGSSRPKWMDMPEVAPAPGKRSSLDQPTMSDADPEGVSPGAQYAMMPPSAVSKPTMVRYQPPSVADRLDGGMFELDEIAAKLTPRMQKKLKKYAEKLATRD